jgi:hypothetical protein
MTATCAFLALTLTRAVLSVAAVLASVSHLDERAPVRRGLERCDGHAVRTPAKVW